MQNSNIGKDTYGKVEQRYHIHVDDMNHIMYVERSYDVVWGSHMDDMKYMERDEDAARFQNIT